MDLKGTDIGKIWQQFSHDYEKKVLSVTSFPEKRQRILREIEPGIAADLGCGPLGLMLQGICRLPNTTAIGTDICLDMVLESKRQTGECVQYILADNRCLPFIDQTLDTVVSVNSFLPESRVEVDLIFREVARVLRQGGRLVALLPAFEMGIVARDKWKMDVRLDLDHHREWDTSGWQCFYTLSDIKEQMQRHRFSSYRVETVSFSSPQEVDHVWSIYGNNEKKIPKDEFMEHPLFEHLLIANV